MELKFFNDTNFIKFWPLPAEILSAIHHYPIHPGNYIPNIPDISVSRFHHLWWHWQTAFCHINSKHLKQLFGHFDPLPLLLVSQQMWHPSSRNLSDFQMLLQNKVNRWKWYAYLSSISRTVNLASPSMISFILETISLRDADFGLPDFGAFLMDSTPDSNFFFHRRTVS